MRKKTGYKVLVEIASQGYGYLENYVDEKGKMLAASGDTLALFVARELDDLTEGLDENKLSEEILANAVKRMETARRDLGEVADKLRGEMKRRKIN